jgi:Protein of unknown function (DUF2569)
MTRYVEKRRQQAGTRAPKRPMHEEPIQQPLFESEGPKEISGWLLVLCLVLTVISPGSSLYQIFANIVPRLGTAENPNRILLLGVHCVLFGALAMFSFATGLKLWLVRPGAVTFTRRFWLTYLIANIAYFGFWMLLFHPSRGVGLAAMGYEHVAGPILPFALWSVYLQHSKRVRETYPSG